MRLVGVALALASLTACDTPNFRTSQFQFGDAKTLAATGNLRFVTQRERKLPYTTSTVICSEPSPDYAVGSGTDANGAIKAVAPSPISEVNAALKTSETVVKLDGREKGVLALRDGLYAACQAYTNGLIGKDAYSIILSQYGLLLVALMQEPSAVTITGDAKKGASVALPRAESASAFAAVLVSCINDADPTRRDYDDRDQRYTYNRLLTPSLCASVLKNAASGKLG